MKRTIVFQKSRNLYNELLATGLCEVINEKEMWLQCEDEKNTLATLQNTCNNYTKNNEPKSFWNYKLLFMNDKDGTFITTPN